MANHRKQSLSFLLYSCNTLSLSSILVTSTQPKQAAGGFPRAALRAGRFQAPHKLINQTWWHVLPHHHVYRDQKAARGHPWHLTNFSHHSLQRLNKDQDSKTHCPVGQGTDVFCIFAFGLRNCFCPENCVVDTMFSLLTDASTYCNPACHSLLVQQGAAAAHWLC